MAPSQGGKGGSRRRQATKNYRRLLRRKGKMPRWMKGKPMMKTGMGGTDKSHRGGRKIGHGNFYYSDAPYVKYKPPK